MFQHLWVGSHKNNHGAFSNKKVIAGEHRKGIMKQEVFLIAGIDSKVPAAFGKETVNVGIPFEIAAKSMKDHDIAGSKIFGMVQIEKHP